jgi:hypothetical protein
MYYISNSHFCLAHLKYLKYSIKRPQDSKRQYHSKDSWKMPNLHWDSNSWHQKLFLHNKHMLSAYNHCIIVALYGLIQILYITMTAWIDVLISCSWDLLKMVYHWSKPNYFFPPSKMDNQEPQPSLEYIL